MAASANLGGLGSREGLRVSHVWQPPPPPPPWIVRAANTAKDILLSALLLLPLFLCKPNRCAPAWAIWLAVVLTLGAATAGVVVWDQGDKDVLHTSCAFGIGLAATWLLSPYLRSRYRVLVFLKTAPVLAAFSLLAFAPRLLGEREGFFDFRSAIALGLGLHSLVIALALVLAGLMVRRRFGRVRFLVWVAVWIWLIWNLGAAPFVFLSPGVDWADYFWPLLVITGATFGLLLPLLLLSFFQPFYRDRLLALLNVAPAPPSSQPAPSPPASGLLSQRTNPAPLPK